MANINPIEAIKALEKIVKGISRFNAVRSSDADRFRSRLVIPLKEGNRKFGVQSNLNNTERKNGP